MSWHPCTCHAPAVHLRHPFLSHTSPNFLPWHSVTRLLKVCEYIPDVVPSVSLYIFPLSVSAQRWRLLCFFPNCSSPIVVSSPSLWSMIFSQFFMVCDISRVANLYAFPFLSTLIRIFVILVRKMMPQKLEDLQLFSAGRRCLTSFHDGVRPNQTSSQVFNWNCFICNKVFVFDIAPRDTLVYDRYKHGGIMVWMPAECISTAPLAVA